jgi:hypothetical protein
MGRGFAVAAVALALAVGGVALAAGGGGSTTVTLCAAKKGGALSLASGGKCARKQRKLVIATQGPVGPQGAPGETGPPGPAGTTASIQPEAVRAVAPVSGDCEATPGTFCGSGGLNWANAGPAYTQVGYWKDGTGEVHLRGTAQGSAGAITNDVFVLPTDYRPPRLVQFAVPNCGIEIIKLQIEASGNVHTPLLPGDHCVSFDGISFRP